MTPGEKLLRDIFEGPNTGDTETLRDKILWAVFGTDDGDLLHPDAELPVGAVQNLLIENVVPLVEEHTRLAVERALTEQREAIVRAVGDGVPPEVEPGTWANDVRLQVWDWAERMVRDFGKTEESR